MRILGIESSADETSAAVVENGQTLLSNVIHSQIDLHKIYGGIVPEVSARSHIEVILPVIEESLTRATNNSQPLAMEKQSQESRVKSQENHIDPWSQVDAIAVTYAPGLIGSLLIGTLTARTLALIKNKPLYPIHHVKAHVYANFINPATRAKDRPLCNLKRSASGCHPYARVHIPRMPTPAFPMLALIVSGGHTQLVLFESHQKYKILGRTQDDAVGEAFDKVAKILGFPYPGGPSIDKAAEHGDPNKYDFPKAKMKGQYDFSFSGLKTAVLRRVQKETGVDSSFPSTELSARLSDTQRYDFAASFQRVAVETLVDKTLKAYRAYSPASVVIAGGVAASRQLRQTLAEKLPIPITFPPMSLCTDNAAMIASCAYYESQFKQPIDPRELEVVPSLSM